MSAGQLMSGRDLARICRKGVAHIGEKRLSRVEFSGVGYFLSMDLSPNIFSACPTKPGKHFEHSKTVKPDLNLEQRFR